MAVEKKLYVEERLRKIMEILAEQKKVEVDELVDRFDVTGTTIRSDLRELQKRNLVKRTHGGALLKEDSISVFTDPAYQDRIDERIECKVAIGQAAANLIQDEDCVLIDDGSTTLQVVRALKQETQATFLTNGLDIGFELVKGTESTVFSTGGLVDRSDLSCYGRIAMDVTSKFNATKAILGASALSIERGITSPSEDKAELKQLMMQQCEQVIIVADHSKIDRKSFIQVADIESVDILIVDDGIDPAYVTRLEDIGIEVIVAKVLST